MSSPLRKSPAVVLHLIDHGESDKIVTFYCPVKGRLTCIAKGAKRSQKRFVNKLELFTQLDIIYAENRRGTLARIDQADLINPFASIRQNYRLYLAATLITELVYHWTQENNGDPELFNLLIWALNNLNTGAEPRQTVVLFLIRALSILGYQPHLGNCLACGAENPKSGPYFFMVSQSGIFCSSCTKEGSRRLPLAMNTLKLLARSQTLETAKLSRLKFPPQALTEALAMLKIYSTSLLHRDIHSWDYFLK